MGFVVFGVSLGLMFGMGLFFLVLYPALRERKQERLKHNPENNQLEHKDSADEEQ